MATRTHCDRCNAVIAGLTAPRTIEISRTVLEDQGFGRDDIGPVRILITVEGYDGEIWSSIDLCAGCLAIVVAEAERVRARDLQEQAQLAAEIARGEG